MSEPSLDALEAAAAAHDTAIAATGVEIWIGAEPTFTDASSFDAEWSYAALASPREGSAKEERARTLLGAWIAERPAAVLLRSVGRQYPGEPRPRFAYGAWERRDGATVWAGPRDPIAGGATCSEAQARESATRVQLALGDALAASGAWCATFESERELCVVARADGAPCDPEDPRLLAPSPHESATPEDGLADALAREGTWLFRVRAHREREGAWCVRVELPAVDDTARFEALLALIAGALAPLSLGALVLAGMPPPVDARVAHTTVTPDPGVIEVNTAPCRDAREFLASSASWHRAAERVGLSPRRLLYNGDVGDSGGGGQITLGGPSADESPFFLRPRALPALVAYLSAHPSLSYLFAFDNVGSQSQAPRADEGLRDSTIELGTALARLERRLATGDTLDRRLLASSLMPFLCDATGNAHRAEINVEKLWNAALPGRGRLGLVELRALRMQPTPARALAVATLLRSIVAMLASGTGPLALTDHGDALHGARALPTWLAMDLERVLDELRAGGMAVPEVLAHELRDHEERVLCRVPVGAATIVVRRALEFWPLVGDASSQEQRTARFIDASMRRVELSVEGAREVRAVCAGWQVPLHTAGAVVFGGVRYRAFVPTHGLHADVPVHAPLSIEVEVDGASHRLTVHEWRPDGGAYAGLPAGDADAAVRRAERVVVERLTAIAAGADPVAGARGVLDLARVA